MTKSKKSFEIINSIARELNQQNRVFQDQVVMKELNENGVLFDLYRCYKEKFFPGTGKKEFTSIYSHTVILVLLSAALFRPGKSRGNDLKKILGRTIRQLTGIDTFIHDILKSITRIDIPDQLSTFIIESKDKLTVPGTSGLREDDILAVLYERFLKRYETALHKEIRYYYTPRPVVSFMVHSIHYFLKEKLKIYEGLADLDIGIFDPAFGTANFLSEVIQLAIEEKTKKYGEGIKNTFIESFISKNIYGFDVMLPLFVMGYLNLFKIIKSFCGGTGSVDQWISGSVGQSVSSTIGKPSYESRIMMPLLYPETNENQHNRFAQHIGSHRRGALAAGVNLYLTDALENQDRAVIVKTETPIGVIFCNPPYSRHSLSKGEWIRELVKDYLLVKDGRIEEKNIKGLQDDYVKFFRFAQWKIDQKGSGIMGFITSNSYLDSPTFRGMRYSLLKSFDEIYILDLHGTARRGDKKNDDENVFGVGTGIAIGFYIKLKRPLTIKENLDSLNCRVFYFRLKGKKTRKLKQLEQLKESNIKAVQWERVFPCDEFYLLTPGKKVDIYQQFIKVTDIFPVHSVGIVTARDKLTINASVEGMYNTITNFSRSDSAFARVNFQLGDDTRDWKVTEAQRDIMKSGADRKKIVPILYRPFDIRYTYYTGKSRGFICMPRPGVMRHMLEDNMGLVTVRQVPEGAFSHCFVSGTIIESRVISGNKGIAYIFPLYKYIYPGINKKKSKVSLEFPGKSIPRQCNIDPGVFRRLQEYGFLNPPSSVQIFFYIYAILHSGIYREKYRDHLKIDFPRIPFTSDFDLFVQLSGLGERLASVHLMKSPELLRNFSKYEVIGSDLIASPLFKPSTGGDGMVYINDTQYFSNISRDLWEYELCGYQILKKWLRDRKNQVLTSADIHHYIKICRAIQLTIQYQEKIDCLYEKLEKTL